jgi:hypothetical protein
VLKALCRAEQISNVLSDNEVVHLSDILQFQVVKYSC